jgi:hypothetical protein
MRPIVVLFLALLPAVAEAKTFYLTIAGLGGEPDFEQRFDGLATEADKAVRAPGGDSEVTTLKGAQATKVNIRSSLDQIARSATSRDTLVLLMIGHGSFDGADYKFNIPGPDLTAAELAALLNRVPAANQLIVDATSSSGAIAKPLERAGRIVITATRDGMEKNATVFGRFWVEALHDNAADVDKNNTVSALEAFNYAQRKTKEFYDQEKRIATEHPLLADGGRANLFTVIRYGSAAEAAADPAKKQLIAKRDDLEARIDALKQQKNMLSEDDYKKQLTALLLDLARTQQEIDR